MKISDESHYIYTDEECFSDSKNVRGFVMKKYNIGMHVQEFYEINIILKGSGYHYIKNQTLKVSKGDVFVIPPGFSHGYVSDGEFDVQHLLVSNKFMKKFHEDFKQTENFSILFKAEPFIRSSGYHSFYLKMNDEQLEKCMLLINEIKNAYHSKTQGENLIETYCAAAIISYMCVQYENVQLSNSPDVENTGVMQALSLIHECYDEKITIKRLARESHISRSSFIRKFTDICGVPPIKYLISVRIEAAKNLLKTTSYTVLQIAEKTGFYDASHFVRCFIRECSCTPDEYRKTKT